MDIVCDMIPSQYDAPIVTSILYREQRHNGAIHHDYRGYRHRERCGGCSWTTDNIDAIIDWGSPILKGCPLRRSLGYCVDFFYHFANYSGWNTDMLKYMVCSGTAISVTFDAIFMIKTAVNHVLKYTWSTCSCFFVTNHSTICTKRIEKLSIHI